MWVDILLVVIILFLTVMFYLDRDAMRIERNEWSKERKDLLDRIQAPTFAEYSNKVVREKKAEQPQEEQKPIEFIS